MPLATIDSVLGQIDDLVRNAGDSDGMGFRLRLEELIKKGGRDTENAIHHYITGTYVNVATRMNLVRMAGYIRSDAFLLPLKKVIDMGEDDLLREEAIISVAKYNDHRALDILTAAMEKNRKPQLQEAITRAIGRIKENNPFLVMLPRFLSGSKNRDLFLVTLKVFKKILSPADAKTLIAYLHHGDQLVGEGCFEVLCARGDEAVYFFVAEYFREHGRLLLRGAESQVGAARLAVLAAALHEYLKRYPQFFPQLRADIADMQAKAGGAAWGGALAALLSDLDPGVGAE
jgi:hypothetical protein